MNTDLKDELDSIINKAGSAIDKSVDSATRKIQATFHRDSDVMRQAIEKSITQRADVLPTQSSFPNFAPSASSPPVPPAQTPEVPKSVVEPETPASPEDAKTQELMKKLPWFKHGARGFMRKLWYGDHGDNPDWSKMKKECFSLVSYLKVKNFAHESMISENIATDIENEDIIKIIDQLKTDLKSHLSSAFHQAREVISKVSTPTATQDVEAPTADIPVDAPADTPIDTTSTESPEPSAASISTPKPVKKRKKATTKKKSATEKKPSSSKSKATPKKKSAKKKEPVTATPKKKDKPISVSKGNGFKELAPEEIEALSPEDQEKYFNRLLASQGMGEELGSSEISGVNLNSAIDGETMSSGGSSSRRKKRRGLRLGDDF